MTKRRTILFIAIVMVFVLATVTLAQRGRGRRWDRWGERDERAGVPMLENDPEFAKDVFTFVRVEYDSYGGRRGYGRGRWGAWATDYPDSDYNFTYRLQQLTSLKVNPNPVQLRLTDDALF